MSYHRNPMLPNDKPLMTRYEIDPAAILVCRQALTDFHARHQKGSLRMNRPN